MSSLRVIGRGAVDRLGRRPARSCFVALALLTCLARAVAAVSVTPVALYIDSRTRTGTLTLFNGGTRAEEVEISFAFGFPQSDSLGLVATALQAEAPAGQPSAVSWLRAFPRRLLLQPGERQVVRVLVQAPAGLAEGEYWARVLIRSRGGQPPVEQSQGAVSVQLNIETVIAIALNYRNGRVNTGVEVTAARAVRQADSAVAVVDLHRTGNAAFVGHIRVEAVNRNGRVVARVDDNLAVYYELRRRIPLPLPPGLPSEPLEVRITLDTQRDDLPPDGPLAAPVVRTTVPVS